MINNTIPGTLSVVFECNKKHALSVVTECQFGRSGTLRTTPRGKSPAESGTAVLTLGINSDAETGSPALNKRGGE